MVCWTGPRDRSVKPIVWSETASLEYQDLVRRISADSPDAARRVANRIAEAVEGLAQRDTGRPGRVRDTFEKSGRRPALLRRFCSRGARRRGAHRRGAGHPYGPALAAGPMAEALIRTCWGATPVLRERRRYSSAAPLRSGMSSAVAAM